ncbi:hypothetical protein HK104_002200 [Borealophlyctis nickersoniae]|nr:hypothetical protein HK104_002200 [Borealophlyctis nickersoniae]
MQPASTSLRVRLVLLPPLPECKCWYEVLPTGTDVTIQHLTERIAKDFALRADTLSLSIDGFDLLTTGSAKGLIRDGDLINVAKQKPYLPLGRKRKASVSDDEIRGSTHKHTSKHVAKKAKGSVPSKIPKETVPSAIEYSDEESQFDTRLAALLDGKLEARRAAEEKEASSSEKEEESSSEEEESSEEEPSSEEESSSESESSSSEEEEEESSSESESSESSSESGENDETPPEVAKIAGPPSVPAHEAEKPVPATPKKPIQPLQSRTANGKSKENIDNSPSFGEIRGVPLSLSKAKRKQTAALLKQPAIHMHFDEDGVTSTDLGGAPVVPASDTLPPPKGIFTAVYLEDNAYDASVPSPEKPKQKRTRNRKRAGKGRQSLNMEEDGGESGVASEQHAMANNDQHAEELKQHEREDTIVPQKEDEMEAPAVEKNYEAMPALVGPPLNGTTIAYKVLELSETYSPEISPYKEATVLAYSPTTNMLTLQLAAAHAPRTPLSEEGELVLRKFDLPPDDEFTSEGRGEIVMLAFADMISPKIVAEP